MITSCASTLITTGGTPGGTPNQGNGNCGKAAGTAPATGSTYPNYVNIGAYALLNFRADYDLTENFSGAVGVTNLLDQDYQLAEGFPEPGRQFYITARARF